MRGAQSRLAVLSGKPCSGHVGGRRSSNPLRSTPVEQPVLHGANSASGLSDSQAAVRLWIVSACPDEVMEGYAHRISAAALRSRERKAHKNAVAYGFPWT